MPKATKIVVHFDDGSTYEIPAEGTGSIFLNEGKAVKCGHKPPYKKPPKGPKSGGAETEANTLMATSDTTATSTDSDACFIVNGLIVCP